MKKNTENALFMAAFVVLAIYVSGQVLNPKEKYCFSFTWLGPAYNNESRYLNATCDDATKLSNNIPCRTPLVITEDGTYPDIDFMWLNYDAHVSCLLVPSEVCASYEFRFNGEVENKTFMCTKVTTNDDKVITSGCYTEKKGGRETEVCICRTANPGKPCLP